MKNKSLTFVLLLLVIIIGGCNNNSHSDKTISTTGTAEIISVSISSKVPGQLIKLLATDGSSVQAGDTIAILEHKKLDLQLQQASANAAAAKAQYEKLKNGARKEDIESARAMLELANTSLKAAEKDLKRIKSLFKKGSATEKQLDDAETRYKIAVAKQKQANAANVKLKNFARVEDLQKAEASMNAANAAVDLIKESISDAIITAPVTGKIKEFYYEIGETVPAFAVLCDILNPTEAEVDVYVSETDLGKVKLGQMAKIYSDSFPDEPVIGKITWISDEAEFTPKTIQTKEERTKLVYKVTITADNSNQKLKSGMPVDVELEIDGTNN